MTRNVLWTVGQTFSMYWHPVFEEGGGGGEIIQLLTFSMCQGSAVPAVDFKAHIFDVA